MSCTTPNGFGAQLEVLLDSQLLFNEQVAVVARSFCTTCVPVVLFPGLGVHELNHSSPGHLLQLLYMGLSLSIWKLQLVLNATAQFLELMLHCCSASCIYCQFASGSKSRCWLSPIKPFMAWVQVIFPLNLFLILLLSSVTYIYQQPIHSYIDMRPQQHRQTSSCFLTNILAYSFTIKSSL